MTHKGGRGKRINENAMVNFNTRTSNYNMKNVGGVWVHEINKGKSENIKLFWQIISENAETGY